MSQTYKNKKGFVIGVLSDDGIFRKKVKKSKHLFRLMDAWGIDTEVINSLRNINPDTEIRIKDLESGDVYSTPLSAYFENGVERDFDTPQTFLSKKYFEIK